MSKKVNEGLSIQEALRSLKESNYYYNEPGSYGDSYAIEGSDEILSEVQTKTGLNLSDVKNSFDPLRRYIRQHAKKSYTYNDSYRGDDTIYTVKDGDSTFFVIYSCWHSMQGSASRLLEFVDEETAFDYYRKQKEIDMGWC